MSTFHNDGLADWPPRGLSPEWVTTVRNVANSAGFRQGRLSHVSFMGDGVTVIEDAEPKGEISVYLALRERS